MDATELVVLVGGVLLIALVLWYFFADRDEGAPGGPAPRSPRR